MKGSVRARAPLRLGLAGGGTDVSPFCDQHGGYVLNAAIDKYAYAMLDPLPEGRIEMVAADQNQSHAGAAVAELELTEPLRLHKGVYNRIVRDFRGGEPLPVRLTTFSEAPAGSGLGSSSTLVVAIIKAFVEYLNLPLGEYEIARLAYQIERIDVGLAGGRQDQYSATFGGFNFMEFYADERVVVNPLRIKNWILTELEASLVLYFTGVSRQSAAIIDEQRKNVEAKSQTSLDASFALKREAVSMKESILKGDFDALAESMRSGWLWKKQLASQITNPQIDETYETACRHGALAGKVSGAGGGGFMFFLVEPRRRVDVMRALQALGGQVGGCHFSKHGTEGWKL
ncbi:MAG: dehydrogenase [Burkholderiales bacterium]|nr:dehydrogenase [Burkholderiales bacterium]